MEKRENWDNFERLASLPKHWRASVSNSNFKGPGE